MTPNLCGYRSSWLRGRDCFGHFGEDRIRIPKPTWRAHYREKTSGPLSTLAARFPRLLMDKVYADGVFWAFSPITEKIWVNWRLLSAGRAML